MRAPPPNVGWASTTCTFSPARAQITAAASPLGPLPTTVTSTRQLQPALAIAATLVGVNLPVVLIADKLAQSTVAALGDQVEVRWVDGPDREKLLAAVPEADALLVRSATTVDAEVLAAAPKLKIVARAGVGLDNVDVDAATARGVLVVNAPTSNIHSAAEHALALLLAAARQIAAGRCHAARTHLEAVVVLGHRDFRQDRRRRRDWAGSASWSPSGSRPSAPTSSPTTPMCRRRGPHSWASNCCPSTSCWPVPTSSRCICRRRPRPQA